MIISRDVEALEAMIDHFGVKLRKQIEEDEKNGIVRPRPKPKPVPKKKSGCKQY